MSSLPKIQRLDPSVAEKIAAGEVIERPSSVVKELVENAIDAGAKEIAVVLEDSGRSLIEVIDNGHGMAPDDLRLSVLRHATSKISRLEDLDQLGTLGFRGEALPSVAAVSELTLLSRTEAGDSAYEWNLLTQAEPVRVAHGHFLQSSHGTRIQSRGLFSLIPARLKFLKSQSAEVSHVRECLERLALSHPQIGFRLVADDRTIFVFRPQNLHARVRAVLADGEEFPIITKQFDSSGLHLQICWVQGMSVAQARKMVQVVNGRAIRDRLLGQAILGPFRQALLPGQFPALALFMTIDPSEIDVNVHPSKMEIRFRDSRQVFRSVEFLVSQMISSEGAPAYVSAPQTSVPSSISLTLSSPMGAPRFAPAWGASESRIVSAAPLSFELGPKHGFPSDRFAGSIFNTYLVYDLGEELALIDQHAAHERVRFEKLKNCPNSVQTLLIPEATRFSIENRAFIEEKLPLLNSFGFEAEIFGEDTLLFRGIPAVWGGENTRVRLKNLIDRLQDSSNVQLLDEKFFEELASHACHSAVRAGDRLEREEALVLTDDLFRCEHPWNCPHGRPTVVRIPRARFEEWFQRRV